MTAQGRMPLVATPIPPFAPLRVTPPAKTTLLRPGSFETPKRSSPRKRTEAPCGEELWIGAILSGALLKTKVILPARFLSSVIIEAPRRNSGLAMYSTMESLTVLLPLKISSPPRKRKLLSLSALAPRRPLAEI